MTARRANLAELEHVGVAAGEAAGRVLAAAALQAGSVAEHDQLHRETVAHLIGVEVQFRRDGARDDEAIAWRRGAAAGLKAVLLRPDLHLVASSR